MDRVISPGFVDSFDGFLLDHQVDAPAAFLVEVAVFCEEGFFLVAGTRFFPDVLLFVDVPL